MTSPSILRTPGGNGNGHSANGAAPKPDLELIIPAYNEQARLPTTLLALDERLAGLGLRALIRVVDNGSTDRTAEAVDEIAMHTTVPVVLQGCSRQGKGAAVARGMAMSRARWVGFCDADLSAPAEAVEHAVHHLAEGWPIVIGSRHFPGTNLCRGQPLVRRLGGTAFRQMTRFIVSELPDTQCGFKFFDGEVARFLFSRVTATGFAFDVEVLALAERLGLAVKQLPVAWVHREESSFRPLRDGLATAAELWRLRKAVPPSAPERA